MTARILLAEDNENLSQLLQKFLSSKGYAPIPARTGLETLQLFAGDGADLLILDLRLPVMNGIDVLKKIRATTNGAKLPVIIMSGVYKGEKYVQGVRTLGVMHYLEKPFRPDDLLKAVHSALQGGKGTDSFMDLLADIHNNNKSGLLTAGNGSPIAFLNGHPFTFISKGRSDFPAFLLTKGKISRENARHFVSANEDRLFFTQAGLLTYDELKEESRLFLMKRLTEVMAAPGVCAFAERQPDVESPLTPFSLIRFLYEAIKDQALHLNLEGFIELNAERFPARTTLFFRRANLLNLREEDIGLLTRIDGRTPIKEIIASGDQHDAAGFLYFLHALGMIDIAVATREEQSADFPLENLFNRPLEEESSAEEELSVGFDDLVSEISGSMELVPSGMDAPLSSDEIDFEQAILRDHAAVKNKDYYAIFGLSQSSFSFNALKEAYFAKTRQYSPEKFMELPGNSQAAAQEILSIYANAYNTLSNVVAKERYDELLNANMVGLGGKKDDKLQAQVQFQSGKVFLEMEEFDNAEKALQDAYTLEQDNPLHCAYLAWAIYCNPRNSQSRAAQEKARALLSKSVQFGKNPEAFAFRGWMLLDEGRDGLAEGEFQKALHLNPNDGHARKGLRRITEKREAEKKGIFRKIFG